MAIENEIFLVMKKRTAVRFLSAFREQRDAHFNTY